MDDKSQLFTKNNDRKNLFLLLVLNTLYHVPKSITYAFGLHLQSRGVSYMDQVSRLTCCRPYKVDSVNNMTIPGYYSFVVGEIQLGNLSCLLRSVMGTYCGHILFFQNRAS